MRQYILKKILLIFPSLLAYAILIFFLSQLTPGDPVESQMMMRSQPQEEFGPGIFSNEYKQAAHKMGLDLPLFYFSIQASIFPDTFYRIVHPQEKKILTQWLKQNASWEKISDFIQADQQFSASLSSSASLPADRGILRQKKYIRTTSDLRDANKIFQELKDSVDLLHPDISRDFKNAFEEYERSFQQLSNNQKQLTAAFPVFNWHGRKNQFHQWIKKVVTLDMGNSSVDAQPALTKISAALFWTLLYVIAAYILSLAIAIPIGIFTAWKKNTFSEKLISTITFIFYAFPLFWLATLAVVFLTNDIYSPWLNIFPAVGVSSSYAGLSLFEKINQAFPHLILPALILSLHSAASGIRIIRNSAVVELKTDYYITAKAKGLSQGKILRKHILPNAMLPVVTMLVSGFPAALAGSVVIEVIFNIPGMGSLLYDSIHYMDWNVVFAILLLIGFLTFIFYLLGDVLYAWLNPKIKYD